MSEDRATREAGTSEDRATPETPLIPVPPPPFPASVHDGLYLPADVRERVVNHAWERAGADATDHVQRVALFEQYCAEIIASDTLPEAPAGPPVMVDVPYVGGTGAVGETLTCTMGNWQNEPTSYSYQWKRDATDVGIGQAIYLVEADDVGHSLACLVTASNAAGSTTAPLSNAVAIA
jgi:hypothetical protein